MYVCTYMYIGFSYCHYFAQILGHLSLISEQSRVAQYICIYIYCHYFAQILGHLSLISEQSRVAQYIRKTLARKTVGDRGSSGKPREREETDRGERGGGGRAVREPAAGNVAKVRKRGREGEGERREGGRRESSERASCWKCGQGEGGRDNQKMGWEGGREADEIHGYWWSVEGGRKGWVKAETERDREQLNEGRKKGRFTYVHTYM